MFQYVGAATLVRSPGLRFHRAAALLGLGDQGMTDVAQAPKRLHRSLMLRPSRRQVLR